MFFGFDWLKEYGPHWTPDTKAFWLDPERPDQVRAWFAKYRPDFTGTVECAGMSVAIERPPVQQNLYFLYQQQQFNSAHMSHLQLAALQNHRPGAYMQYSQSIFGNMFGGLL